MDKSMSAVKNLSIRLAAVGGDKVRQEFKNLGNDGDKAFRRITQVITPANDNLKALDATARSFNEVIRQGTALFGAYLGLQGLKNTFSAIFSANTSFEQLSGSLKTVTGSAKGAQEAFSLIEKFAIDTPYQLNEIVEAFIQLKALGLEPSEDALVSYGNTASAFGKNIKDFVGAVAAATVGEFERLKTFGIKAKVINDDVSFTFAGVTTKVKKNATEIEKYLRTLGDVNFAGAMNEQMKTMNGVLSNIEDGFEKIYRDIGKNGLNEALKSTFTQFNELVESGGSAAKTIGQTLAFAVNTASSAFFLLAEHADVALTLIGTRLGSSAILGGINLLKAGVGYLQVSIAGLSISAKSAVTGIAMMSRVSKLAAIQMGVTAAAAGILKGALALIGGPAGLAVLAGMAIYKLVDSHDVAKRAAEDHAETLQKLQDELKATTEEAAKFSSEQSKDMALAEWGLKLKTAEQNIKDLRAELKNTGGLSFTTRFTPNTLLKDYEIYAKENALNNLNTSSADYQKYKDQIGQVYDDMVKKANETALQSSKSLEDGFKRGFLNIQKDVNDFASLAESAVKNAFNSMEDTLTSFITTGKASFSDFANAIISDLTRIIIRQSITQPLMNGLGGYLGFAMAHTGGIVGADNLALKSASPLAFADAPRFHSGGIVGDEVPIIAKRGEGVFTREQMKALGDNGSTVNISVNVVNNAASDVKASVSQSNQGNGKFNLDIMIEKIESSMSRNVSKGTGIAPALERRYGLNPAYGSYG